MDGSAFRNLGDGIGAMMIWAIVGMVLVAVAALVGIPWFLYYLWSHLQWV